MKVVEAQGGRHWPFPNSVLHIFPEPSGPTMSSQFHSCSFITIPSASGPETLTKAQNLPVRLVRRGKRMKVSSSVSLSSFLFPSAFLPPNFLSSSRQKQNPMSIGLLPPADSAQTTAAAYKPRCSAANIILRFE